MDALDEKVNKWLRANKRIEVVSATITKVSKEEMVDKDDNPIYLKYFYETIIYTSHEFVDNDSKLPSEEQLNW